MATRRKARETALQILYKVDMAGGSVDDGIASADSALPEGSDARAYCDRLVSGVLDDLEGIDRVVEEFSENWSLERMAVVDRNILRIAVYEFMHSPDIPFKVVIDEAVELAKRFGSDDSGAFINGILDRAGRAVGQRKAANGK